MKTYFKVLSLLVVMLMVSCTSLRTVSAQQESISFQVFYDELSPYGQWVDFQRFGYVWIPDVSADFAPYYTDGYWVMTNYGWTWSSDYNWGWATFHYGRWDFDDSYGWFWVPGNEWGPSWVIWRQSEGYYGWTPMRPGMDVNISFSNGYSDIDRWNFVPDRDFGRPDMDQYYVDKTINKVIIINSTVINNTYIDNSRHITYISGPRRDEVQRSTGRNITNVTIRSNNKPGQRLTKTDLRIYRPEIRKNNGTTRTATPTRVTNIRDVKPTKDKILANPGNSRRTTDQNNNGDGRLPIQQKEVIIQPQQAPERRTDNQQQPVLRQNPVERQQPVQQQQQPVQRIQENKQPARQAVDPKQQEQQPVNRPQEKQQPARQVAVQKKQEQQPARKVKTENSQQKATPSQKEERKQTNDKKESNSKKDRGNSGNRR
ncbi:MAG: DUF6600 domain-containing protein [Paludibacter sp.]